MSITRPPCGLTKQEVMALDERERVLVVDGRCQNGYTDAEGDHICGNFVGAHPSELAGASAAAADTGRDGELIRLMRELQVSVRRNHTSDGVLPLSDSAYFSVEMGNVEIQEYESTGNGSVLAFSDEEFQQINDARGDAESVLVEIIYPKLVDIVKMVGSGIVINNSEAVQFLPVPMVDLENPRLYNKPDMNLIHPALYKRAASPSRGMHFGAPNSHDLDPLLFLMEAKVVPLANKQIGVLMRYLKYWFAGASLHSKRTVSGIVFNAEQFVYASYSGGVWHSSDFIRCRWNTIGSVELLQNYITAAHKLKPNVVDPICAELACTALGRGESYLGSGAEATAIMVKSANDDVRVLKIYVGAVEVAGQARVSYDRIISLQLRSEVSPLIVQAVPNSLKTVCVGVQQATTCSGFLLLEVGTAAPKASTKNRREMLQALQCLHSQGVVHNDARLPNLVMVDGKMKWIDLGHSSDHISIAAATGDVNKLILSIYSNISSTYLSGDAALSRAIEQYSAGVSGSTSTINFVMLMDIVLEKVENLFVMSRT